MFATPGSRAGRRDRLVAGGGAAAFERPGRAGGDLHRPAPASTPTRCATATRPSSSAARTAAAISGCTNVGDVTYVCGNTDTDAAAEFQLAIHDGGVRAAAYSAEDFLL